jgi:hypothetical protein
MKHVTLIFASIACSAALAQPARAASFSIETDATGWVSNDRFPFPGGRLQPYNVVFADRPGTANDFEARNYFQFSLPAFSGRVSSARLRLRAGLIDLFGTSQTYRITSLASLPDAADDFPALGTGTIYGERSFSEADQGKFVLIDLNKAGIVAMESGGIFRISGRLANLTFDTNESTPPAQNREYAVFGLTGTNNPPILQFDTTIAPVPELASWAMLITGFGLAGAALRRRRVAIG